MRLPATHCFIFVAWLISYGTTAHAQAASAHHSEHKPTQKLLFGVSPYLPLSELRREFDPLVSYLHRQLGIPVELHTAQSYDALAQQLFRGEIHFAELTPFSYVEAKRKHPDLVLIAAQIADGAATYASYFIVRDDSGITSLQQLRGKRFAFVDKQSASGYLYPLAYLRKFGIDPATFFADTLFSGNHDTLALWVRNKTVDGGAVASTVLKGTETENAQQPKLRILAKTGRIPYSAYVATPRLDRKLVERIRASLLRLSTRDEEGRRVLNGRKTNINGFVAVGDEHYDDVRRIADTVRDSLP